MATFDFTGTFATTTTSATAGTTTTGVHSFNDNGAVFIFSYSITNISFGSVGQVTTHPSIGGATGIAGASFSAPAGGPGTATATLTVFQGGNTFFHNPVLNLALVDGTVVITFDGGSAVTLSAGATPITSTTVSATGDFHNIVFTFGGIPAGGDGGFGIDTLTADLVCFLEGTKIASADGEIPVEELETGDLVTTADGGTATVRWVGVQEISPTFATPQRDYPVRIRANALGDGVPSRDLYVTGEHALFVDGLLINAGALVNGTSITRVADMGSSNFRYYHIETDAHDLVLAENTPAETFVDYVTRGRFQNHAEYEALYGDEAHIPEMDVPRVSAARLVPQETQARLAERAEALGYKGAFKAA